MPRSKTSLERVIEEVCRHYSVKKEELRVSGRDRRLSEARGMAAWLIMELGVCTLGELEKRTTRDVATLSSSVKRLQIRAKGDLKLERKMKELLEAVS